MLLFVLIFWTALKDLFKTLTLLSAPKDLLIILNRNKKGGFLLDPQRASKEKQKLLFKKKSSTRRCSQPNPLTSSIDFLSPST